MFLSIHVLALKANVNFMWSLFVIKYVDVSGTYIARVLLENGLFAQHVDTIYRFNNLTKIGMANVIIVDSCTFCIPTLILRLEMTIFFLLVIANQMRNFMSQSNDPKCMWNWSCPQ